MKKALLLLACIACLAACKKEKKHVSLGLSGKWELWSKSGGFAGGSTPYPKGNGNIYQFNNDSTYIKFDDNKVTSSGKFHINISGTGSGFQYGTIKLDDIDFKDAFAFKADSIYIGSSAADGISLGYIKIK